MADPAVETITVTPSKPKPKAANNPSLGSLENDLTKSVGQTEKDISSYQDAVGKITGDFHDQLKELRDQAPKPPDAKPFEAPEQKDPISLFGSTAGIMAALASAFTRAPLTASLNSMAAGMKAINDGNATAYQRAFDEFKTNTDYAFKTYDAQTKAYDQMLDLAKTNYDAAIGGIKTLATLSDDKPAQMALAAGNLEKFEELQIERDRQADEHSLNQYKLVPAHILDKSIDEFKIKNGRDPSSQELGKLYQDAQNAGVAGMQSTAQMIAHYQMPMPTGYALKNMGGDELVQTVQQIAQSEGHTYNAVLYGSINKAYDNFTSGKNGTLLKSGNVAIQHLTLLKQAFDALENKDLQTFNAIRQRYLQLTGSPLPTNFDAVSDVAAQELVKFVQGGGATGGALGDRDKMRENISRALSGSQGTGVFDMYIGLMAGQMAGLKKQYEVDDLDYIKPFEDFLSPETTNALATHSGGGTGSSGADYSHLWK